MLGLFRKKRRRSVAAIKAQLSAFFGLKAGYSFRFFNENGNALHEDNETLPEPRLKEHTRRGIRTVAVLNERIEGKFCDLGCRLDAQTWNLTTDAPVPGMTAYKTVAER